MEPGDYTIRTLGYNGGRVRWLGLRMPHALGLVAWEGSVTLLLLLP